MLNRFQKIAAQTYGDPADHVEITDATTAEDYADLGDTLLTFIMRELADAEDHETAESRMNSAARQLLDLTTRIERDVDEGAPEFIALFVGQAWIMDNATPVDGGVFAYSVRRGEVERTGGFEDEDAERLADDGAIAPAHDFDGLLSASYAPKIVREWSGPFEIEVYADTPRQPRAADRPRHAPRRRAADRLRLIAPPIRSPRRPHEPRHGESRRHRPPPRDQRVRRATAAGLDKQLAAYCREWWEEIADDGATEPPEGMTDAEIVSTYFDSNEDETLDRFDDCEIVD